MLHFYTNPQSRGRIARWMLEEIGQPYETTVLDYYTSMKAPEYLKLNPMGKVPTLVHDGKVVTENAAICTYLAMTVPEAGLMAEDKAAYFRWTRRGGDHGRHVADWVAAERAVAWSSESG